MAQNLDVFDSTLTEDQMAEIATMDTGVYLFFDHRDPARVSWLNSRRALTGGTRSPRPHGLEVLA
jgi:2,5-diketo-D-gluconate reductase A